MSDKRQCYHLILVLNQQLDTLDGCSTGLRNGLEEESSKKGEGKQVC